MNAPNLIGRTRASVAASASWLSGLSAVILFFCLGTVVTPSVRAQCLFPYWRQLSPGQSPAAQRIFHALAYDSQRRVTVLFGGRRLQGLGDPPLQPSDFYNDTWEFDGTTWTQRLPNNPPFPLALAAASYDPVKHATIVFGGEAGTNGFPDSGFLWEWDGEDWREVSSVGPHPAPRTGHQMVYDSVRHVHVMYGGSTAAGRLDETWEYDAPARTWTLRSTAGPGKRSSFALAYDSIRNRTVLFGGRLDEAPTYAEEWANDTWVWESGAGTWQQLNPAIRPSGRSGHAMSFDSTRGVVVLLGGEYVAQNYTNSVVTALSSETWEWDGVNWASPPFAYNFCCGIEWHSMVYETARQQVLLFQNTGRTVNDPMITWAAATGNGRAVNYVDWSNFFGFEDGTPAFPFSTLHNAVPCTLGAATISVRGGD